MKKMRILTLILAILMALALVACDSDKDRDDDDDDDTTDVENGGNENGGNENGGNENGGNENGGSENGGNENGGDENGGNENTPPVKYTITWIDENGNTIATTEVTEGSSPSYSYTPTDTAEWDHTFEGWSASVDGSILTSVPTATENASYYAKVSSVKKVYAVNFNVNGGSDVAVQNVEYGALASAPEDPEYSGYRFMGWYKDSECSVPADFSEPVTAAITYYALWEEQVDIVAYLETLLSGYKISPYYYIPESMRPDFAGNLVDPDDLISNYSSSVSVSNIKAHGFGEQWNMVIDNIEQSTVFFNALSVVEGLTTTSVVAFRNYFDNNPADTATHSFESGIYAVTIKFDGEMLYYVSEYTASFPVIGEQTAQIALVMDVESGEKRARIQLGDANALTYVINDSSYEFAIKYLGVRRAYFGFSENYDGSISGHIYEYLTVSGVEIASAADFYITDNYVSAVGNKADGMIGFTGYISELYSTDSGRLVGYEVREELLSITYNTLWFNLCQIDGIDSVRYAEIGNEKLFFVNGSSDAWEAKTVGGSILNPKRASRRFDIEFRTQYFYSYDEANDEYVKHSVLVPMIFIQEECYDEFASDVYETNGIAVTNTVNALDLIKLESDYDTLVDVFIVNKELITVDIILAFIGDRINIQ